MSRYKFSSRSIVLTATLSAISSSATAELRMDLRATSVNGQPLSGAQTPHLITGAKTGDVIAFDVFAIVTGTDASLANDRIVAVAGGFVSSPIDPEANLRGTLRGDVVRSVYDPDTGDPIFVGFDQVGWSVGFQRDLDFDGDLDVGSFVHDRDTEWWAVRYGAAPNGPLAPPPIGRQVGFGTFTVTSSNPGSTLIQFTGRQWWSGGQYHQDGVFIQVPSEDSLPEHSILVTTVPEPTLCAASLSFCSIILATRRRRRQ